MSVLLRSTRRVLLQSGALGLERLKLGIASVDDGFQLGGRGGLSLALQLKVLDPFLCVRLGAIRRVPGLFGGGLPTGED